MPSAITTLMHIHELFFLSFAITPALAFLDPFGLRASVPQIWRRNHNLNDLATNSNGSDFLWLPQDEYSGKTFFECVPRRTSNQLSHSLCSQVVLRSTPVLIPRGLASLELLIHCAQSSFCASQGHRPVCVPVCTRRVSQRVHSYVNQTYAFDNQLAYVNDDGTVVMKVFPSPITAASRFT